MWIKAQNNRLVNLDKIESVELTSRRETTAGSVVFELIARPATGQPGTHILARYTEEEPGQKVLAAVTNAIKTGAAFFDVTA